MSNQYPFIRINSDQKSEADTGKYRMLPYSLARAFETFENDHDFLFSDGVFSEKLIDTWTKIKRDELGQVKVRPHPWEFRLYYDA